MRTHGHNDQQIARGAAVLTRVALRAQRNGLPVVDARRNADLDGLAVADHALAAALGAGLMNDLTLASAALAGGRRRHIAQRRLAALLDHAAAAAVRADLGGRALGAARAAAVRTLLDAVDTDFLLAAEGRLFKADVHARAQAFAALGRVGVRARAAEAPAEEAAEDIAEVAEVEPARAVSAATGACAVIRVNARKAELVVARLLVWVAQNLVRLVDLLELLLGFLVAGVHVGMILACELFVCFFDLFFRSALGNAEHLVIVSFIFSHRLRS